MKISKIRIKNYRSIKDSGEILLSDNLFVLAGQNESGKSSILEALNSFQQQVSNKDNLNFDLENKENLIQEVSCSYTHLQETFYKDILIGILEIIKAENPQDVSLELKTVIKNDDISKIQDFTITRTFNFSNSEMICLTSIDSSTLGKLKGLINNYQIEETDEAGTNKLTKKSYLDIDIYAPDIADIFWKCAPKIILFNDFTILLPDKILLDDLSNKDTQGYDAVRNLEKILKTDYRKIALKNPPQKNSTTESESAVLSANFQQDWQQKIYASNKVNIKFFIENNEEGKKEILFYVETKDNEFLAPRRRSKGMIWFLSLWLELKAKENDDNLILLFDEPGLHLHIKANKDMLSVFHKLNKKGHQIIYSTHSPSLIETDKLHNIGLVINNEKHGTLVEGLTTSKINTENKKDALYPIAEAMGMEPLKDFSVLREKNVILEGLSDFWYFKGMIKLLGIKPNYEFIPGIGVKGSKILHLISFSIGYGLEWVLVMDNGVIPNQVKTELIADLFAGDMNEGNKRIKIISEEEIENIFDVKDLILIDSTIKVDTKKTGIEIIGERRKIIFSKMFYQKVENNEIDKNRLQPNTLKKFEDIFNWIEQQFSSK
jgi:predicted ATPase